MNNVAIIVAHPDDEALGCGGTLFTHLAQGDRVHLMYLTDGISARTGTSGSAKKQRESGHEKALKLIKPHTQQILDFPDNKLDTVALLDIVKKIEAFIQKSKANVVYTHYQHDLNIDHTITNRAVLTACRPVPGCSVKKILSFETPSSTEWANRDDAFRPNCFVDISAAFKKKMALLKCYDAEMRPAPHARSYEAIEVLAKLRGACVGKPYCEAFMIEREII